MSRHLRAMLEGLYDSIYEKFHDSQLAWDRMLELIAVDQWAPLILQLDHKFEWLFDDPGLIEKVRCYYDPKLLRADVSDTIGQLYYETLTPRHPADQSRVSPLAMDLVTRMAEQKVPKTDGRITVIDPSVGTGRFLMAAHTRAPNGVFYGVGTDLREVRIAWTNLLLRDIHGYVLHANPLLHALDLPTILWTVS